MNIKWPNFWIASRADQCSESSKTPKLDQNFLTKKGKSSPKYHNSKIPHIFLNSPLATPIGINVWPSTPKQDYRIGCWWNN